MPKSDPNHSESFQKEKTWINFFFFFCYLAVISLTKKKKRPQNNPCNILINLEMLRTRHFPHLQAYHLHKHLSHVKFSFHSKELNMSNGKEFIHTAQKSIKRIFGQKIKS